MNPNEPLWLPRGSVRAILGLLIVIPLTVIMLRSNIVLTGDQAIGLATLILSAYFIQKAARGGE